MEEEEKEKEKEEEEEEEEEEEKEKEEEEEEDEEEDKEEEEEEEEEGGRDWGGVLRAVQIKHVTFLKKRVNLMQDLFQKIRVIPIFFRNNILQHL